MRESPDWEWAGLGLYKPRPRAEQAVSIQLCWMVAVPESQCEEYSLQQSRCLRRKEVEKVPRGPEGPQAQRGAVSGTKEPREGLSVWSEHQ